MKDLVPRALTVALLTLSFAAHADPTSTPKSAAAPPPTPTEQKAPQVLQLAPIPIYGCPNKPQVVIVIKTPTAAEEAAAAHEEIHAVLLKELEPPLPALVKKPEPRR